MSLQVGERIHGVRRTFQQSGLVLRPPPTECSTDQLVDDYDEEALEHLLGVDGSASIDLCLQFFDVVGEHETLLLKGADVTVDCRSMVDHHVSLQPTIDESGIQR